MSWSAEQLAMLKAMGLRVWVPAAVAEAEQGATASVPDSAGAAPVVAELAPARAPAPQRPMPERQERTAPSPLLAPRPLPPQSMPSPGHLDWGRLQDAVRDCRACALCEGRQQAILGRGPARADWLIVADPPDEQEDREGALFVGAAGRLLDNMLAALGLGRVGGADAAAPQVYLTSALKCRAPRNRNPSAEELARCAGHLLQQIALLQPKVILSMGRFANWQLLGQDQPLGPLRGQPHQAHGVPVVVTYHPLYLLRHQADKPRAWDDLCRAAAVVRGG